ncbi:MAG: hypothetical protein ABIR17_09795 [Pseudolysinimonas sp.]|uniref:hypothetical protein n=1 Tax=Pseudolysinimonas sp. TaxID=2680009 RepID=UPI003267F9CC
MRNRLLLAAGLAAASLLVLAGCGAGGSGGGGDTPGASGGGSGSGLVTCLAGTWKLDGQNNADQMQAYFTDHGTPVTSTTVDGDVTLTVTGANMTYTSAITYTMTASLSDGLDMVIAQNQAGTSSGRWSATESSVVYSNWSDGITITNSVSIGGQNADMPLAIPASGDDGVPMTTTCNGDTLTTHPDASPFTSVWTRVG